VKLQFGDPASIQARDHGRMLAIVKEFIEAETDFDIVSVVSEFLSEREYEAFWGTEDELKRAQVLFEAAAGNPQLAERLGL
jgi:hypothetical protein